MSGRGPSSRALLVALLVVPLLGGCVVAPPTLHSDISDEARRAIALLEARRRAFSDLRTLAELDFERMGSRTHLTGVLLARAPASLRFEALSPFGQPFLIVTIHDGRLMAYDLGANEVAAGPATPEVAAEFFHLALSPEELVAILTGHVLAPGDLRAAEFEAPDDLGPSLTLIGPSHRQRVWMDFSSGLVRQVEIAGGRAQAVVTYLPGTDGLPAGFDLAGAPLPVHGRVRYQNPVVDGGVAPERFIIAIPPGVTTRPLR